MNTISERSLISISACLFIIGCTPSQKESSLIKTPLQTNIAYNDRNHPDRIAENFVLQKYLYFMPKSGQARKQRAWTELYTDAAGTLQVEYWPAYKNGTARGGYRLSPMGKYDLAFGKGGQAFNEELNLSKADSTTSNGDLVTWAGHCNGLAAAAINHPEPKCAVFQNGVQFTPHDIKALLTEAYQGSFRTSLIGDRCGYYPDDTQRDAEACEDINAGTFHMLLGTIIGKHSLPFIMDVSQGDEVWNYPVNDYTFKELVLISPQEATSLVGDRGPRYLRNPEANAFARVRTEMILASGHKYVFDYVLELKNAPTQTPQGVKPNFIILGGEWIGESVQEHPDFAWVTYNPYPLNEQLDVSEVFEMAHRSANCLP